MIPQNQSIIDYMPQIYSGEYFYENFQNVFFLANEQWITLQGTPQLTANYAITGIYSFDCTAPGLPVIQKGITLPSLTNYPTPGGLPANTYLGAVVIAWFYDDGTTTITSLGPFLKVDVGGSQFLQVGARNGTSTTHYSVNPSGNFAADTFAASSVARSVGWHKFEIRTQETNSGVYVSSIYIDGTLAYQDQPTNPLLANVFIQSDTVGSGAPASFGAFAALGVYLQPYAYFFNANTRQFGVLDPNNAFNLLASTNGSAVTNGVFQFNPSQADNLLPASYYVLWSQTGQTSTVNPPLAFVSDPRPMNPGDIYLVSEIEFGRKVKTLNPMTPTYLGTKNQPNQGSVETLVWGRKDQNQFSIQILQGAQWQYQADNLFSWTGAGNPFSLITDGILDAAFGFIAQQALAGSTQISLVSPILNGSSTSVLNSFTPGTPSTGPYFLIRDQFNQFKQIVTIASVTAPYTVVLNEPLQQTMNPGDFIHGLFCFPFIEFTDLTLDSLTVSDPKYFRYKWDQMFRDWCNNV